MILKVKLGGRESYFKMGDIWRVYVQKGRIQRRRDWRSKRERQGREGNRVLKLMEGMSSTSKAKERR